MRSLERIDKICAELAEIWSMVPDWRLAQLMTNAMFVYHNKFGHDAFYVEDNAFMSFLKEFINKATNVESEEL